MCVAKQNRISLNEGNVVGYDMNESKGILIRFL
jgi:hypothetical protein